MSTLETNLIQPATGTSLTLGASGDTITIPSGATITNSGTATGFGGANTPYFMVKRDSDQTISHNSSTKITFDSTLTESSSGVFDLSNNKFTVVTAGKYVIAPGVTLYDSDNRLTRGDMYVYKNGSALAKFTHYDNGYSSSNSREYNLGHSFIASLSASDYLEMYVYVQTDDSGSVVAESDYQQTSFGAFKIIE